MSLSVEINVAINQILAGNNSFKNSTPLWDSQFGDDGWFDKFTGAYLLWNDYVFGRGSSKLRPNATNRKYVYCLTPLMVSDLKVAAAIHGLYPSIMASSGSKKAATALATVKGRIDEVAKLFSLIIAKKNASGERRCESLSDFTINDLKYGIHVFTGRPEALKRALKLISHQVIQKNLSAPLQWTLLDVTKSTFDWGSSPDSEQIATLTDSQFLMLLEHSKRSIAEFMLGMNLQKMEQDIDPEYHATKFDPECLAAKVLKDFLRSDMSPLRIQLVDATQ